MDPRHGRRGPWSQQEDDLLMQLVKMQGALNWVRIATELRTRTPKQCRERYHQNLKPTLNHEPISQDEGVMIERLVLELGKRWAEIARRLNGRSDNAVKNWWNGSQNRRKRMDRRRAAYDERTHTQQMPQSIPPQMHQHITQQSLPQSNAFPPQNPPRTLPMPRGLAPPPLMQTSLYESRLEVDTPLTSPLAFSPTSEQAPSLVSDSSSRYSTSPRPLPDRGAAPERVIAKPLPAYELPPLKMTSLAMRSHPSPGYPAVSPSSEMNLPPISHMVPAYPQYTPPEYQPSSAQRPYPTTPQQDYFSGRPLNRRSSSPFYEHHQNPHHQSPQNQDKTKGNKFGNLLN